MAQGGGPQPGGVVHPPNPRGWLLGEVQAIRQIYLWSKNTRTHGDLEWFGPPECNTLRPLRVVLLLWISLSSSSKSFLRLESFSSGRLPFYSARRTRTQALDPDIWAQQGCIVYYEKDINSASVVENLFPYMLHRPVDSLTEGNLHLSHR